MVRYDIINIKIQLDLPLYCQGSTFDCGPEEKFVRSETEAKKIYIVFNASKFILIIVNLKNRDKNRFYFLKWLCQPDK